MSRKKPVILGPDGQPYVAPPKKAEPKKAEPKSATVEFAGVDISADVKDYTFTFQRYLDGASFGSVYRGLLDAPLGKAVKKPKPLAEAVADQVHALSADFDGAGIEELPRPAPDLHTYADAYVSAVKNCLHPSPESTLYSRGEFFCPDCQRYFGPEEYKRTRRGFGFGGLFG